VCTTSGMEHDAVEARASRRRWRQRGAFGEVPSTSKPSGSRVTRSPWLIQTSSGRLPRSLRTGEPLRPRHRRGRIRGDGRLRPAAELRAHGLLAVADAEHRHAESNTACGARGEPIRFGHRPGRRRGSPPFGFRRSMASSAELERHDLAIDAGFAHAPGDQLRDLTAEIDDQDRRDPPPVPVFHRSHAGIRSSHRCD
jgi:hypothetical protein